MAPPEPAAGSTWTSKLSSKIWRPASLTPRSTCDSTISKLAARARGGRGSPRPVDDARPGTVRSRPSSVASPTTSAASSCCARTSTTQWCCASSSTRAMPQPRPTPHSARSSRRRSTHSAAPRPARAAEPLLGEYDDRDAVARCTPGPAAPTRRTGPRCCCACTSAGERRGFSVEVDEATPGQEGGTPLGHVHRARPLRLRPARHRARRAPTGPHVAVSDAQRRRQTSFASLDVVPFLDDVSDEVDIDEKDLRHRHLPLLGGRRPAREQDRLGGTADAPATGLVVSCQNERSQHQNKAKAMQILAAKLAERNREERAPSSTR